MTGTSSEHLNVYRAAKDITFGSIAGMASKILEHPFDLTKVRLQSQVLDSTVRFTGPWDCLKKTWQADGVRGLYRGLPAPLVGAMFENASLFFSYNEIQSAFRRIHNVSKDTKLGLGELTVAAAGAGAITSFFLTPIELVKCKMQVQSLIPTTSLEPRPGPLSVFVNVLRTTGVRGLWLGHTGTMIRETGGTAVWFGTKEAVASFLLSRRKKNDISSVSDSQLKPWESALSGACAGAAFNLAFFPADTVKSAVQTRDELLASSPASASPTTPHSATSPTLPQAKSSFIQTFRAMYVSKGLRGLYAGCGITILRSIPSSGLIFLIWDGLNKQFPG